MNYYLHSETVSGTSLHMIAAPMPKIPGGVNGSGLLYGRYVVRARIDPLYGYHASFLLWPDSNVWPRDGEIDWPESDLDATSVSGFMHWQNGTSGSSQAAYSFAPVNLSQWHTYEIDWTSSACSFYIDGSLVGSSTDPTKIPNTPMHWVLQTGLSFGEGTPSNSEAGNIQIDWVTAYTPT